MTFGAVTKVKCHTCNWEGRAEEVKMKDIIVTPPVPDGDGVGSHLEGDIDYEPTCPKCNNSNLEFS